MGRPSEPIDLQFEGQTSELGEQRLLVGELTDIEIHRGLQDGVEEGLIRGEVHGGDGSVAFWVGVGPTLGGLRYLGEWPPHGKTRQKGPWDAGLWGRVARPVLEHLAQSSAQEREVIWKPAWTETTSPMGGVAPDAYWAAVMYLLESGLIDARLIDGGIADVRLSFAGEATLSGTPQDPLEVAEADLRQGNLVQAAAYVGNLLDRELKELAIRYELQLRDDRGREKLLGPLNDELKRAGAYGEIDRAYVQGWLAVRNAAVHNRVDEIDPMHVQTMIEGMRSFVTRLGREPS